MSHKKGILPADKQGGEFLYRIATLGKAEDRIGLAGVEDKREAPIVLATEAPVQTFDRARMEVVDEVLSLDGMSLPKQIPLLNSHHRGDARRVIGSIRELEVTEGNLIGRAFFASSDEAKQVFELVRDGHITDVSVGAMRGDSTFIPRGEAQQVGGRAVEGPARIVTRSALKEGSIVAVGADENAKIQEEAPALRAYLDPHTLLEEKMNEKLKALCVARGMDDKTEGKDVLEWLARHMDEGQGKSDADDTKELMSVLREIQDSGLTNTAALNGLTIASIGGDGAALPPVGKAVDEAAIVARTLDITRLCDEHDVERSEADQWIKEGLDADQVAGRILAKAHKSEPPVGMARIESGEAQIEKFSSAVGDALVMRALQGGSTDPDKARERANGLYESGAGAYQTGHRDPDALARAEELKRLYDKPAPGWADFRHASLSDIARAMLEQRGKRTFGLTKYQIARQASDLPELVLRADTPAFHTTGSFSNLMLDAANKTLLAAYDEAAVTYPIWVRQAPSAADFKQLNRIRFGEMPDPEIVPENADYKDMTVTDNREFYKVEKYGQLFSISFEAVVNDDMNAISRIPGMQGNAMRRKINKVVYAILTANEALSDGTTLFHASSHGANLDSATLSVAAGVAALNTGYTVMATQAGLTSGTILNITPRFLIVPAALAATALSLIASGADPTGTTGSTEDAVRPGFSSGVINLYGPNGPRRLVPVVEGQLDGTSTTGWYLAADASQVDTVELTFLQGEESPVLEREQGFVVDAIRYKIRQTFASKAIDFRGLYQGNT